MFTQSDWWEVTKPGVGTNRYAYAGGDPVNASDPGGNAAVYRDGEYIGQINPGQPRYDDDFAKSGIQPSQWVAYNNANVGNNSNAGRSGGNNITVSTSGLDIGGIRFAPGLPILIPDARRLVDSIQRDMREREWTKLYVTYTLSQTNGGSYVYVGRTSGFGTPEDLVKRRFRYHHMRAFGYGNPTVDESAYGQDGYRAIRGREQQLYDFHYPTVGNSIRPVARGNANGYAYWEASNRAFGPLSIYSGI